MTMAARMKKKGSSKFGGRLMFRVGARVMMSA